MKEYQTLTLDYRKGVDVHEYIACHLADILPYDKDNYHFTYKVKDNQINVNYLTDEQQCIKVRDVQRTRRERRLIITQLILLFFLVGVNYQSFKLRHRYKLNQVRMNLRQIYRNHVQTEQSRQQKKNLKYNRMIGDMLRSLTQLPLNIYYLSIDDQEWKIGGYFGLNDHEKISPEIEKFIRKYELNIESWKQYEADISLWLVKHIKDS